MKEIDPETLKHKKMVKHVVGCIILTFAVSCTDKKESYIDDPDAIEQNLKIILEERVFSKEEQDALTPEMVLEKLVQGNLRFKSNTLTARNHSSQVRNSVQGQFPKAVVLSCLDSRIPVEDVFDKGIGDLFVARVAGNFANPEIHRKHGVRMHGRRCEIGADLGPSALRSSESVHRQCSDREYFNSFKWDQASC